MQKRIIKVISQNESRKKYINNNNFKYQINKRLKWMRNYTKNKKNIIEFGSGNGLSKKIINKNIITTDINNYPFIDIIIDMNNIKLPIKYRKNIDVIIFNHSLHHSKNPIKVLKILCKKFLKKNGYILINEPELSFFFKVFLKICNHEKYDENLNNINKKDFWYENNATGRILFGRKKKGDKFLNNFVIIENSIDEFLIFLNSGGNSVNSPHIKLNKLLLNMVNIFDNMISKLFPRIFGLNRRVVLKKIY